MSRDYTKALNALLDAEKCPNGLDNPFIKLRIGQSFFEKRMFEKAKKYLTGAYMLGGDDIFEEKVRGSLF